MDINARNSAMNLVWNHLIVPNLRLRNFLVVTREQCAARITRILLNALNLAEKPSHAYMSVKAHVANASRGASIGLANGNARARSFVITRVHPSAPITVLRVRRDATIDVATAAVQNDAVSDVRLARNNADGAVNTNGARESATKNVIDRNVMSHVRKC